MLTLGIETSCDETSAAVVEDGRTIRSNIVASQVELHSAYGGVVPELAARSHLERLPAVVDAAVAASGATLADIDLVAVTRGPGLVGALLVGVGFARGLALDRGLPLVGVSHLDGHVHSAFLGGDEARTPMLILVVSGGHTELLLLDDDGGYRLLGRTLDDAAGEAFDKVARLLGLPYPGGPAIERLAATVERAEALRAFPLPAIRAGGLDFSFSGIKTSVRYALERRAGLQVGGSPLGSVAAPPVDAAVVAAAAAAFQARAVDHLVDRLAAAVAASRPASVAIAGGVAGNGALRRAAAQALAGAGVPLVIPEMALCTDNAAMIAAAGHHLHARGAGGSLEVDPGLRLAG